MAILLSGDLSPSSRFPVQDTPRGITQHGLEPSLCRYFRAAGYCTLKAFSSRAHIWFFILQVQDILQLIAGPSKYFRLDLATQLFQLVANLSSFSISCLITFTLMMYQFLFIGLHLFAGDISLYGLGLFLPSRYPVKVKSSISDESKPIAAFTKLNSFRIRYVHIQSDDLYFIGPPPTTGRPCI